MNTDDIDDDDLDYNAEAAERAFEFYQDRSSASLDHVTAATTTIRICIDVVVSARIGNGCLTCRALDQVLEHLIEVEGDLSRATGELLGADPHP